MQCCECGKHIDAKDANASVGYDRWDRLAWQCQACQQSTREPTTGPCALRPQGEEITRPRQPYPRMPIKFLVIVPGKGTPREHRIVTTIVTYWCESVGRYCTLPRD
jgi:hypothetical protein